MYLINEYFSLSLIKKDTMKKLLLLFIICPVLLFSQVQIGQDIDGFLQNADAGRSVSLSSDGSVIAIGAPRNIGSNVGPGYVGIYSNENGVWTPVVNINGAADPAADSDRFGYSVSLSSDGNVIAIGSIFANLVRVYRNLNGLWSQVGSDIDGESPGDQSGFSVSLSSDGNVVAIGARQNDGNAFNSGHVRVYRNLSDVWTQIGSDIEGEAEGDESGFSVSLSSDGTIVAIGAPFNDGNGNNSGHARIYSNQSDVWTQVGSDIDGELLGNQSGSAISLSSDGSVVAIGAPLNGGNGNNSGHVRVYRNLSDVWTQIGSDIDGAFGFGRSGNSVSLSSDGSVVAIGASWNNFGKGKVRIYSNLSDVWTQVGSDIDGESAEDFSGTSVSLSSDGSVVAIGAPFNFGGGFRSGHVRVYDLNSVLLNDDFVSSQFSIYPNPTTTSTTISLKQGLEVQNINVYNNLGQLISTSKSIKVDTSNLTAGLYFLDIETNIGKATKKLIIQ
jgi:hypothetical protein